MDRHARRRSSRLTARRLVAIAALAVLLVAGLRLDPTRGATGPTVVALRIENASTPFAGDGRLLTTVSPNGDGFRDRAIVHFRLLRRATVELEVVRAEKIRPRRASVERVHCLRRALDGGRRRLTWRPRRNTPPGTYILLVRATAPGAGRPDCGDERRSRVLPRRRLVARIQVVDAAFTERSYPPGGGAKVAIATDASRLRLQVLAFTETRPPAARDAATGAVPVGRTVSLDWRRHRNAPHVVGVPFATRRPTGLYFLRVTTADRRVGYAPFVIRPRVAVVLPTHTWQAYNFYDADGDGEPDTWYGGTTRTIDLRRPHANFGVPFRFREWDLGFLNWLTRTRKQVDFLADDDLERVASGDQLASRYDLVVFAGHEEYVTRHAYDVVERYRDLGGNLVFLSANNFFWQVRCTAVHCTRTRLWRQLGRPEAALVGAQYVASNTGAYQSGFVVTGAHAVPWAFAGTGLTNGSTFGRYGIEIDARSADSPPGVQVLATIPSLIGRRSAEMTYYETSSGAKVFAAGVINFTASLANPRVSRLLQNVWERLSRP